MYEKPLNNFEKGSEAIPTLEEVKSVLEQLIGNREYKEVLKLEDESGLYLLRVVLKEDDGSTEYEYMRKGIIKEGQASNIAVHITFFDESGIPIGGHLVARLLGKDWELTP